MFGPLLHTVASYHIFDIILLAALPSTWLPGVWSDQCLYFRYQQNKCLHFLYKQYIKKSICDDSHNQCLGSDENASDQKEMVKSSSWTLPALH